MYGQTFAVNALVLVGLLVILEGVLSINTRLSAACWPSGFRARSNNALTYGLAGASFSGFSPSVLPLPLATAHRGIARARSPAVGSVGCRRAPHIEIHRERLRAYCSWP